MKNICFFKKSLTLLSALALSIGVSRAQVLMFDFGPTTPTGTNLVNSPYHTTNLSFSGSTWNVIGTGDVASGALNFADGTTATGMSLNIGATTGATTASSTLLLSATPSGNSALGSLVNTGIYTGDSVGKDGVFTGSGGAARSVGFQLSGLTAGIYDIYVIARNTSTNDTYAQNIYAGATATTGNFVIDGGGLYTSGVLNYTGVAPSTSSWVQGENYLKLTVTIASGNVLNLASLGGGAEGRGFLNSVQIVAVPEPSTVALIALGLACASLRRRSRVTMSSRS